MRGSRGDGVGVRDRSRTRWDIQGLRAFAVLSVLTYHLWPNRVPGGFVGVDVFFVISGFLITGHLVRAAKERGRVELGQFWSRRAKRILPSAFLTLAATGVAVLLIAPSSLWGQYARELISSAIYLQNWQLASDSVNYLAQANQPSPFQHFWSLSVEEQFYIALPLLLVILTLIISIRLVTRVRLLLVLVFVLSLAWCIHETTTASGVAYFSTATRAWEFAAGGLMSTVAVRRPRMVVGRIVVVGGAWLGAALLIVSLVVIDSDTKFPGYAAILPVAGASLVVLLGGRSGLEVIGGIAPIAFIGRISYSVYLWHWPAVVLLPLVTRHELTLKDKLAIVVLAIGLGAATTLLVEEPLRFSQWIRQMRPRRVAVLGLVSTVVVLALGVGSLTGLNIQQQEAKAFAADLSSGQVACFGAAAQISSATPCVNPKLADVRVPAASVAVQDDANRPACWSNVTSAFNVCQLGPKTGYTKHFLAVGDSHNNVLVDTYAAIARKYNWRIDVAGHIGCYFTTANQFEGSDSALQLCNDWKAKAMAYIKAHKSLTAVITTHSTSNSPVLDVAGKTSEQVKVDGMVGAWRAATDEGVPVIAIRDNPHARDDVVACVAQMVGPTTSACDQPRNVAFRDFDGSAEAVAQVGLARDIDLSDVYCTKTTCPAVMGGVLVYRDPTHMTKTFAKTLTPYLGAAIARDVKSLRR